MGLFSNLILDTFEDLLIVQLQDLYDAERRLIDALPRVAEAASLSALKSEFMRNLGEARRHLAGLESVFERLGLSPRGETCEVVEDLIAEGEAVINADGDADVRDAALIAWGQRVAHYEAAGYASTRKFAAQLGHREIAEILRQNLDAVRLAGDKLGEIFP